VCSDFEYKKPDDFLELLQGNKLYEKDKFSLWLEKTCLFIFVKHFLKGIN
jgi:hypothetical protein